MPKFTPGPEKSYRAIAWKDLLAFFQAMNFGMETWWKNSHHRVRIAAQNDGAANQGWIASEVAAPQVVAQDRGFRTVGLIFLRQEPAPDGRRHAKYLKVFRRDMDSLDLFRMISRA